MFRRAREEARREMQRLRGEIARLLDAERAFREIVHRTNAIVLRWDPQGRILFMNDFGQRLFGYAEEELIGQIYTNMVNSPARALGGRFVVLTYSAILK